MLIPDDSIEEGESSNNDGEGRLSSSSRQGPEVEMTAAAAASATSNGTSSRDHSTGTASVAIEDDTPSRTAMQRFFYPKPSAATTAANTSNADAANYAHSTVNSEDDDDGDALPSRARDGGTFHATTPPTTTRNVINPNENDFGDMNDPDVKFVHGFWTTFDDILILSIFTQLGIVFRLASSTWFAYFDDVFSENSALFVNLPLNCLSCFLMGLLCSGERLMEIILTRFTPSAESLQRHDRNTSSRSRPHSSSHRRHGDGHDTNGHGGTSLDEDDDGVLRDAAEQLESPAPSGFGMRRRRRRKLQRLTSQDRAVAMERFLQANEEMRDVQLLALERRIRMSKCLVLFPVRKEDVDVMEHYFDSGYKRRPDNENNFSIDDDDDTDFDEDNGLSSPRRTQQSWPPERRRLSFDDLALNEDAGNSSTNSSPRSLTTSPQRRKTVHTLSNPGPTSDNSRPPPPSEAPPPPPEMADPSHPTNKETDAADNTEFNADFIAEFTNNVQENVQENIKRLRRVNLADGWDSGTTPEAMSDDLLLGLRDGFCGALSSFSSWNSSMIRLMRHGNFGHAFVGYMLGLQLPIIAYRCGQHVAVYIFVWRTRREAQIDERRGGYGIRVNVNEELSERSDDPSNLESVDGTRGSSKKDENEMPSLRAVITAFFIMALVTQCTSINFFSDPNNQQIAMSLLFSPLGVFARWRIAKLNNYRPTFPLGTFTCNILACALSGSLGSLLAGNPGPRERIVLVSIVAGFGGTLSSVAAFIVEVLAGVDPILFRFDGMVYALASIGCAMVVGFVFSASAEWADETSSSSNLVVKDDDAVDLNQTRWY